MTIIVLQKKSIDPIIREIVEQEKLLILMEFLEYIW